MFAPQERGSRRHYENALKECQRDQSDAGGVWTESAADEGTGDFKYTDAEGRDAYSVADAGEHATCLAVELVAQCPITVLRWSRASSTNYSCGSSLADPFRP